MIACGLQKKFMLKMMFSQKKRFFIINEFLCVATIVNEIRMQYMHDFNCCYAHDLSPK